MEWIGPFVIGILVASALLQLLWAWSLSVIAEKTEQSALMQFLAWVPILQIAPMIAVGGGSVARFLLGAVALVVGSFVLGIAGAVLGNALGLLGFGFITLFCIGYFARLAWNTSTERDQPGWVGLLLFLPLVNLFVYPYLAFHDGWARPQIAGLAVGLLLTLGTYAPSFQAMQMLNQEGGLPANWAQLAELAEDPAFAQLAEQAARAQAEAMDPTHGAVDGRDSTAQPTATIGDRPMDPQDAASVRALYRLQGRFAQLDELTTKENLRIHDHRLRAIGLVQTIRSELDASRPDLGDETYFELARHLVATEARVHEGPTAGTLRSAKHRRGAASPGPAAPAPRDDMASAPPIRPLPVQATGECPRGTELQSSTRDGQDEEWCQQLPEYGGLRHGWYARYLESGQPESIGEYRDGLRVGVWTRFHPSGRVRVQAQFEKGLQHGWLLSFDEQGQRTKAARFTDGVLAR